jgi:TM2 domain-containing membrane protein YozV
MADKKAKVEDNKKDEKIVINNNITTAAPSGARKVNWTLTLIMSIVFGTLGVDRFIMGQVGLGILKLITLGGCGIWWLIDVILIATKHQFNGIEWADH